MLPTCVHACVSVTSPPSFPQVLILAPHLLSLLARSLQVQPTLLALLARPKCKKDMKQRRRWRTCFFCRADICNFFSRSNVADWLLAAFIGRGTSDEGGKVFFFSFTQALNAELLPIPIEKKNIWEKCLSSVTTLGTHSIKVKPRLNCQSKRTVFLLFFLLWILDFGVIKLCKNI